MKEKNWLSLLRKSFATYLFGSKEVLFGASLLLFYVNRPYSNQNVMKHKEIWIRTMLLLSFFLPVACSDDLDVSPLKRDTDVVQLAYNAGAESRISVRYAGSWTARAECLDESTGAAVDCWFDLSPASGVGNGRDYQWLTLTAERNPADARKGYIYIKSARGEEVKIEVTQADGFFKVKEPVIAGALKSNTESAAALTIEYEKAFGGETVEIMASLSGNAAQGLFIRDTYQAVIEREGNGTISVPITGTPAELGELTCHVTFKLDGEVKFDGAVSGSVTSSNEVFGKNFDAFKWGGDYPNNKKGPGPNGTAAADKNFDGSEEAEPDMITAGSDGTKDIFKTMTEQYRINRGVEKWTGERVYEHPGYVKLGVTADGGWIMTPELEGLSAAPETVTVSIDFLRFDNETGTYVVSAEGAGTVINGEVNNSVLPAQTTAAARKWKTLQFTVKEATNKTRIKIAAQTSGEKGFRINIDNILVMAADKVEITEKLPAPDPGKITFFPSDTAIEFAWEGVKGATAYEASLALQSRPDFRKTILTEESGCVFDKLEPGLYLFTVRALYAPDAQFDSEVVAKIAGTMGFAAEKLAAPEGLVAGDPTPTGVEVSWQAVSGAARYRVIVRSKVDGKEVISEVVAATSHAIAGLAPGTEYVMAVRALAGDGSQPNEFDSDEVTVSVTTPDPVALSKPTLAVYDMSYAFAIVEFGFDTAEQQDTKFGIQLLEGGKVIREYTKWSFNNKYTKHGTRFLFGGLADNQAYAARIRRIALDTDQWSDSEWSDELPFTTAAVPDKTGYLLWQDFDNHPWGGNGPLLAFGIDPKDADKSFDVTSGQSESGWQVASPVKNMDNLGNGVGSAAGGGPAAYHSLFMSGWDSDELKLNDKNNFTGSVYLCGGMMKFGTGSSIGRLTLPKFAQLTDVSTLEVTFNACPYYEPNNDTGSLQESPAAADGVEFMVTVNGGGVIVEANGAAVNTESVKLRNKTAEEMQADLKKRYEWTGHTVKVAGATAETRISIHTIDAKGSCRMWLDDLKVRKE